MTLRGRCHHEYWWESDWTVIFVLVLLLLLSGIWILWEGLNCNEHSQHWLYFAQNPLLGFSSVGVVLIPWGVATNTTHQISFAQTKGISSLIFQDGAEEWRRGDDYPLMSNKMHSCYNGSSQNVVLEEVGVSGNCSLRLWNVGHARVTSGSIYLCEVLWCWESAGFSNCWYYLAFHVGYQYQNIISFTCYRKFRVKCNKYLRESCSVI